MARTASRSTRQFPTIWGQQAGYLYIQLRDFKRGDRKNDIMQPIASSLEREDMLAISRNIFRRSRGPISASRARRRMSRTRAVNANRSIGCTGCHLDHFQGDGTVPRLAGMGREYLAKTIDRFPHAARAATIPACPT